MRLKAALEGNLDAYLKKELLMGERAVTKAVRQATSGLKQSMRSQVVASGLGPRLARTWRGDVYPRRGESLKAAGLVYTKAQKIMEGFEEGQVIRAKDGFWLAIPTPNAPKRVMGKRVTPGNLEKARGMRLQFVYRKRGPSLLVAQNMRASYSRKTGELRGFRKASQRALKTGNGLSSVVMFWLVPQVKLPKLIRFEPEAIKWHSRLPEFVLRHWKDSIK
ncbi:DUF6441 family protein [Pseudemcibacter aquimaris]|uniref:DUF6441 family protein n=2 Tax=Pseudemcibacter aquimaris TaxID=2857064 RepID=UPI00237EC14A|nr:DUF6441 family protein [Pseudemcibacter aquimaris]WDU57812.1 hypothetical protein KW060_11450 [Pseudemcibacter aquimaris]